MAPPPANTNGPADSLSRDASTTSSPEASVKPDKLGKELVNYGLPVKAGDQDLYGPQVTSESLWDLWKPTKDEAWYQYLGRLCREGHTVPDAFLNVAAAQIGQIMLTCPNALWEAGLIPGCLFMFIAIGASMFTTYLMNTLYLERKRAMLQAGTWGQGRHRHATQYHDVLGFFLGKNVRYIVQTIICLQLLCTGVAQVIACAGDHYTVQKAYTKRELQLIWGAVLQLFILFPTFRHLRILNILALSGTTFTAIYILNTCRQNGYDLMSQARLWPAAASPTSAPEYFFLGCSVLLNAVGGHAIMIEQLEAMESPKMYTRAYFAGWLWIIFLVIPPSIAVNLAYPTLIGANSNVYGVLPMSNVKIASVALMIFHQFAAYAYYVIPALIMWERAIGTHTKPLWIRLPSRLPISLLVWLFAMAFPFYGSINSLMAAVSVPFTAFGLPAVAYILWYWKQERRDSTVLPPYEWLRAYNWKPAFVIAATMSVFYFGFGFAGISYSIKSIYDSASQFGVFARCYQCPANYESYLAHPGNGV